MSNGDKVQEVRFVEKCPLTRVTKIPKSMPSGQEMARISDNSKS